MLPAEKTHYRKGLALGMTLAETFSVVVFILLLACAVLLLALREEQKQTQEQLDDTWADLAIAETMLLRGDTSWTNTDAWFEEVRRLKKELTAVQARADEAHRKLAEAEARVAEAEAVLSRSVDPGSREAANRAVEQAAQLAALRDSLHQADEREARHEVVRDSLEARLADAERVVEAVRAQVAQHQGMTPAEADSIMAQAARAEQLSRELDDAHAAVRSLDARRREVERMAAGSPADSLRRRMERSEMARADAVGRAEYREDEIRSLMQGRGVDPPPCWMDEDRTPQHFFRVELADEGMRLVRIASDRYPDDEAVRYAAANIEDGRVYSPDEFLRLTEPIHAMGRGRTDAFGADGCRFWVQPVDRTGESKDVFRERVRQLGQRFWFRW